MKQITNNTEEIVEIQTGDFDIVLRPGQTSSPVSNEVAQKFEGREGFTVRDTSTKKKGGES